MNFIAFLKHGFERVKGGSGGNLAEPNPFLPLLQKFANEDSKAENLPAQMWLRLPRLWIAS
ncbi:MAG TPA: hypothetical protein ENJ23_03055 [Bacteroidetes bacterium]|nr:hypothetical protein [Bacteroidota bacterium]